MIRVLYAEDDPQVAGMVRMYFQHHAPDCTLEVVPNGRECLTHMARGGVDVLLLDLVLPDIDGLNILSELSVRRDTTPVIIVSSYGQNELAVRALRAGAVDCVDKTTPQFLQIPEIVKRVHARHQERRDTRPPAPARAEKYNVLLIESSATVRDTITSFFGNSAPQMVLTTTAAGDHLERTLSISVPFDAVIIGPNPGAPSPLDVLRQLHSHTADMPALVISARSDGETAVACFKLGAQDYILLKDGYLPEVVFSINHIFRRVDTDRLNVRLTRELEELNRSLEAQVAARTQELQAEVAVRKEAEKRAEEYAARLKTLSARLLRVQEDERRAIARELHDQVGQMVTGLKFQLEAAFQGDGEPAKKKIAEALALTGDLLRHVRELTQQFRPRILDDLGLRPALEWHANLFQRQTGIKVEMDLSLPAPRLPTELETTVFRIVQEALTNVARHAAAPAAHVTIATSGEKLLVEITDRGRGFDLDSVLASRGSVGLTSLSERVSLAGGRLEIFARLGQGTRLHAEFPLPPPADAPAAP